MVKQFNMLSSRLTEKQSDYNFKNLRSGESFICIFCLILLALLFCSCQKKRSRIEIIDSNNEAFLKISINPDKTDKLKLSSIAVEINYIIPDNSPESIFGSPDKVVFYDSLIFISDTDNSMAIFCFTRSGRFMFKIDKQGNGPEEYTRLSDFAVDRWQRKIVIYDDEMRNLLFFDLKGNFIKKIKTGISADRIEIAGEDRIMYYSDYLINSGYFRDTNYQVFICDYNNRLHEKFLPFPADNNLFLNVMGILNNTSASGKGCYVYPTFNNRIYSLKKDKLTVFAEFDFLDKNPPDNFLTSFSSKEHKKNIAEGKYITGPINFQVTEDWLVAIIPYKKKLFYYLYDIKTGFTAFSAKIDNDIDKSPFIFIPPLFTDGTDLFCFIEPYLIEKTKNLPGGDKVLPEEFQNYNVNNNPILQVIKLK